MKESLVKRAQNQLEMLQNENYVDNLVVLYQKCFPAELFKKQKIISAEFILDWNQSTLDCIVHFVNLLSEFQNVSEKDGLLMHNIKAMQFILVTNVQDLLIEETLPPFLP